MAEEKFDICLEFEVAEKELENLLPKVIEVVESAFEKVSSDSREE